MSRSRLQERLDGLRETSRSEACRLPSHEATPLSPTGGEGRGEVPESLGRVERALLGASAESLPLRERLRRLADGAARRSDARRSESCGPSFERFAGEEVSNERGSFLLVEKVVPLDGLADAAGVLGQARDWLNRLRGSPPENVTVLSGNPDLAGFDLTRAVFLDTETTGLSGGTGTAAFLVGTGHLTGDRFVVRQYFMRDYNEEPALLARLAEDLSAFSGVITYNGSQFDLPLLETRYRLDRSPSPLLGVPHLDLLQPARRLWKARFGCCRLQTLEAALLGVRRVRDVPGQEIPQIYFRYIRGRGAGSLGRVLQHNYVDVLSLAALLSRALDWVGGAEPDDPHDAYSLGRVLERARLYERAEAEFRRALRLGPGRLEIPVLMRLGYRIKRRGDHPAAARLWERAAEQGECRAFRELALYHERRCRDFDAALEVVEKGLARLDSNEPCCRRTGRDLSRRRVRLRARIARRAVRETAIAEPEPGRA